jgi:hypothetical protein
MSKARPVSFRLPSKYVVFLDTVAAESESDRTAVLIQMLERYLNHYLSQVSSK